MNDQLVQRLVFGVPAVCLLLLSVRFGGGLTGFSSLAPVALIGGVLLLVAAVNTVRHRVSLIGGRKCEVHTNGGHGTRTAAWHEGGHAAMVKAAGGRVKQVRIFPDGSGYTSFDLPCGVSVTDVIAIDVAGHVASGTSSGCGSDFAYMRQVLNTLPSSERGRAKAAGYARARQVCNGWLSDGGVSSTAKRLLRDGRI